MSWTYQSWGTEYPRMAADLTGNHAADIIGFGYDGKKIFAGICIA